jgi:hypothetical protein
MMLQTAFLFFFFLFCLSSPFPLSLSLSPSLSLSCSLPLSLQSKQVTQDPSHSAGDSRIIRSPSHLSTPLHPKSSPSPSASRTGIRSLHQYGVKSSTRRRPTSSSTPRLSSKQVLLSPSLTASSSPLSTPMKGESDSGKLSRTSDLWSSSTPAVNHLPSSDRQRKRERRENESERSGDFATKNVKDSKRTRLSHVALTLPLALKVR